MRMKSLLPGFGGALLMGCVVACSDSTSPGGSSTAAFDAQVTNDIAPTVGKDVSSEALFYDNASNSNVNGTFATTSFAVDMPTNTSGGLGLAWIDRNHCQADGLGPHTINGIIRRGFWCSPFSWGGGYTDSVTYQVFKTDTTTDSVEFAVVDTGAVAYTWNSRTFADTVGHHRNATLILENGDTVHVWNSIGNSSIKTILAGPNVTRTYTLASNDTTTGLTFYVTHRGRHRYPIAGTIIRNYTITRLRQGSDTTQRTTTRRVVVTFDSTGTSQMTINGTAFTFNLQTPQMVTAR
jgi:hypothetical protein